MNRLGMWKRIRVYLIGFGIGMLMTYFFFGDRGCGSWLPGNRVKSEMTAYKFLLNDYMSCQMEEANLTSDSLARFILNGDVSFPPLKRGDIRVYSLIDGETAIDFSINSEDSTMYIEGLPIKSFERCDTLNKVNNKIIELPFREILKEKHN